MLRDSKMPETPCTCAMLRRTARRLTKAYDQALKPAGLRLTQYSVLANVERLGGRTITELSELLAMDRTTLTRNLRPLVRQGWVTIENAADRRGRAVELTESGRHRVEKARPLWREAERAFRRSLGREDTVLLRRLLDSAIGQLPDAG